MNTRMTQGIAAVAVFGALALSAVGGYGSVGATSPDVTAQTFTASAAVIDKVQEASHGHSTMTSDTSDSTSETNRIAVVAVPAPVAGHLPLTKGGKFP